MHRVLINLGEKQEESLSVGPGHAGLRGEGGGRRLGGEGRGWRGTAEVALLGSLQGWR